MIPFKKSNGRFVVEDQMWSAKERMIIARTKQYLEESYSVKVEVEELENLLGLDDVDVDFRRILKEARDERRVTKAVEDYLDSCAHVKVDIEVLESLMEPENLDVSPRYVLKYSARRGSNIFQLFDTSEKPSHFVASRRRWLESQGSTAREWAKRVA